MHNSSATCISVYAVVICIIVVPLVLVSMLYDMHTSSATCISVYAVCLLAALSSSDMHTLVLVVPLVLAY